MNGENETDVCVFVLLQVRAWRAWGQTVITEMVLLKMG